MQTSAEDVCHAFEHCSLRFHALLPVLPSHTMKHGTWHMTKRVLQALTSLHDSHLTHFHPMCATHLAFEHMLSPDVPAQSDLSAGINQWQSDKPARYTSNTDLTLRRNTSSWTSATCVMQHYVMTLAYNTSRGCKGALTASNHAAYCAISQILRRRGWMLLMHVVLLRKQRSQMFECSPEVLCQRQVITARTLRKCFATWLIKISRHQQSGVWL